MKAFVYCLALLPLLQIPVLAHADIVDESRKLMIKAVENGDTARVQKLLATPWVDIDDTKGSYLARAVFSCNPAMVKLLVDAGIDLSDEDANHPPAVFAFTGTYTVPSKECLTTYQTLLDAHPDLEEGIRGTTRTPLQYLASNCGEMASASYYVTLLRAAGASVNSTVEDGPREGWSVFHIVADDGHLGASADWCVATAKALVKDMSDIPQAQAPDLSIKLPSGQLPIDLATLNCPDPNQAQRLPYRQQMAKIFMAAGSPPPQPGMKCPLP